MPRLRYLRNDSRMKNETVSEFNKRVLKANRKRQRAQRKARRAANPITPLQKAIDSFFR